MLADPLIISDLQRDLLQKFQSVRKYSEQLCRPLQIEDYIPQPVFFASPPKWHLAHTSWFFEELVLKKYKPGYKIYHEDYSYLFNSYYNFLGKRIMRADRGNMTRPGVKDVYLYRKYIDEAVTSLLEEEQLSTEMLGIIELGLNHEQQHQELLITDLKYTFAHNPVFPVYQKDFSLVDTHNDQQDQGFVTIPEGIYEIGYKGTGFCYDNELAVHKVYLHKSEISTALVTNGEFMEFMEDNGYGRFELWLDDGWSWVKENNCESPLYWHKVDGEWHHYTLSGFRPVDPDALLCHVSFYEASAFAEWKGMRLPTEFEWEAASDDLNWGARWEWTNSAYLPYPGFNKAEGAIGEYNGKFMVNQMVLRGASTATSPGHSRKTYRNFFHPNYQWQCTGIRLAKRQ